MTINEYYKLTGDELVGRKVTTTKKLHNSKREYILEHEICTITRKFKGLTIMNASGIIVERVEPEYLDFYNN